MISTKLELDGDVQEQSFTSALLKSCSEKISRISGENIFIGVVTYQDAGLEFATLSESDVVVLL